MSSRLVDNVSPALMAAMVLISRDGETELVARDGYTPAELARALRNLAFALDAMQDAYDEEMDRRND